MSSFRTYLLRFTLCCLVIGIFFIPMMQHDDADEILISFGPLAKVQIPVADQPSALPDTTTLQTGLEDLPPSLEGTNPDGQLHVDGDGNLIITADLRNLFDYFLSSQGEEDLATIYSRIKAYIRFTLPSSAVDQAETVLESYIALQTALAERPQPEADPQQSLEYLSLELQQLRFLRREHLTPEVADVFYGEEEQYDQYSLAVLELMNGPGDIQSKQDQVEALQAALPDTIQNSLRESRQLLTLQQLSEQLQDSSDNNVLNQQRHSMLDADAVERLAALDQQRAAWNQRIESWLAIRDDLAQDPQLDRFDKQQLIAQLRIQHFHQSELNRVKSLERILNRDL